MYEYDIVPCKKVVTSATSATRKTAPRQNWPVHGFSRFNDHNTFITLLNMPARLPDDVLYRIKVRLDRGDGISRIQKEIKASSRTLRRIRDNFELFGEPYPPQSVVLGRPRTLLPTQEMVIFDNPVVLRIELTVILATSRILGGPAYSVPGRDTAIPIR
jgi:hypothetical protein